MLKASRLVIDWKYLLILYLGVLLLIPVEFYKIDSGLPVDIQFDRIVALGIFALWVAAMLVTRDTKFVGSISGFGILVFAAVILISFILNMQDLTDSMRFASAVKRLLYVAMMVTLFFFVVSTIKNRHQIDHVLKFSVAIAFIVSLFCFAEFLTGYNVFRHIHDVMPILMASPTKSGQVFFRSGYVRVMGSADHPISLGVMLSLFIPLVLHYYQYATRPNDRLKYGVYMAAIMLAMVMTISRTPLIAVASMLIVYVFYRPKQAISLAVVLIMVSFAVHMVFPGVLGGLTTYLSPSYLSKHELTNPYGRAADHPKMLALFYERPVYGRGYGWWNNETMFYVDNQYLKVLVELGVLGALGLAWMFLSWLKEAWSAAARASSKDKDLLVAIIASCVAYIATLAAYDSFGYAQVTYLFFVMAGLGVSLARIVRRETADGTKPADSAATALPNINMGVDPHGV